MLFRFTLLATLVVVVPACNRVAQGDRNTPDLVGRVMQSGKPVAGASIVVARAFGSDAVTCRDDVAWGRTDEYGRFTARANRRWRSSTERRENADHFLLCIRREGQAGHDSIFRALATRWDSLQLECDLARSWLLEDQYGSSGQCLIAHYALDGQRLAMRIPRFPPLTCDTTATEIGPLGIGPIRPFSDVGQLRRLCPGIRDTLFTEPFMEIPGAVPRLVLDVAGEPVIFSSSGGVIFDIVVSSPKFHTADGLRVGMPMSRLADRNDLAALLSRESDGPYLLAWQKVHCGMAFASGRPGWNAMSGGTGELISMRRLRAQPATLRIRRIYAGSCMDYHLPAEFRSPG